MARHVLNPDQLAMFMPAHELASMHSLDTAGYDGDTERMREGKRRVNRVSSMGQSVATEGVHKPVQIAHGRDPAWNIEMGGNTRAVANGNHRVTAALDANPHMEVPVLHYGNADALFNDMRVQDRWD